MAGPRNSATGAFWAIFVKLFLGAGQYIIQKDAVHAKCIGLTKKKIEFQRPFFFTAGNFLAMLLVVLPLIPGQWRKYKNQQQQVEKKAEYSWRLVIFSGLPAVLDVAAVLVSTKATEFLPASVVVLLKATRVIFAAGLTSVMLKKRVLLFQWTGIAITCLALVPIYIETMKHADMANAREKKYSTGTVDDKKVTTKGEVIMGLGFILAAELMRALRFVYEEWLIKKQNMTTEFLLISECTIGAITAVLACGVAHAIGHEDYDESWARFRSSRELQALFLTFCFAAGICNVAGTFITKYLSSVVSALVSELRVVLVFVPNVIRYKLDIDKADSERRGKVKGEPLDGWSALKILGFILLILGAYVYNGKVKLPCVVLQPPPPPKAIEDSHAPQNDEQVTPREVTASTAAATAAATV
jgi:drug/metabolite transporter (DMT)-like permease